MSKAVMISIRPKWCALIANGEKTVEIRKTRPKLDTPFKCYIYCTQGDWITSVNGVVQKINECEIDLRSSSTVRELNSMVIGEFICDEITDNITVGKITDTDYLCLNVSAEHCRKSACLTERELYEYSNGKPLFGWHISALQIYDEPKELSAFHVPWETAQKKIAGKNWCLMEEMEGTVKRPPQSWCYVEEL